MEPLASFPERIRVLHVDDDADFVGIAADYLEREDEGIDVTTETDPSSALDRIRDGGFDCVVSDYDMPGKDGLALLSEVKTVRRGPPFRAVHSEGE